MAAFEASEAAVASATAFLYAASALLLTGFLARPK